ncbi:unnamed protein product, partial [Amoebophrya sp. A120]
QISTRLLPTCRFLARAVKWYWAGVELSPLSMEVVNKSVVRNTRIAKRARQIDF